MGAFLAAYVVVWLAVVLYVIRLGATERRTLRSLEALQEKLQQREKEKRGLAPCGKQ